MQIQSNKSWIKRNASKIIAITLSLLLIVNAVGLYIGNIIYNKICKPYINRNGIKPEYSLNAKGMEMYNKLAKEEVSIVTRNGYISQGTYILNPKRTKNTVIIMHGMTTNRYMALRFLTLYLNKGFNVLVFDSRNHGTSGGTDITYGYYEKLDLDDWVSWLQNRNENGIIGIHATSMGGAVSMMHSEMNEGTRRVRFYIIDSAFSDLKQLLRMKAKDTAKINNTFLADILIEYSNIICMIKSKFSYSSVSPIKALRNVEVPMMFIHGTDDEMVPKFMSEDLFRTKKGNKRIYICPGAVHSNSIIKDSKEYTKSVYEFIDNVLN